MSKLIRQPPRTRTGFNDPRSTGAARPIGALYVNAPRGTLKTPR